jgi:hypothetical protein
MGWRVGAAGVRVHHPDGSDMWHPPGSVLDSLPDSYTGELERIDEPEQPKRLSGYRDKMLHPAEDK